MEPPEPETPNSNPKPKAQDLKPQAKPRAPKDEPQTVGVPPGQQRMLRMSAGAFCGFHRGHCMFGVPCRDNGGRGAAVFRGCKSGCLHTFCREEQSYCSTCGAGMISSRGQSKCEVCASTVWATSPVLADFLTQTHEFCGMLEAVELLKGIRFRSFTA